MPIDKLKALPHVLRLASLPYYPAGNDGAVEELVTALAAAADSEREAEEAISSLLGDVQRAASPATNRVPSPGELRLSVTRLRPKTTRMALCQACGDGGVIFPGVPDRRTFANTDAWLDALEAAMIPCPDCAERKTSEGENVSA